MSCGLKFNSTMFKPAFLLVKSPIFPRFNLRYHHCSLGIS
jgi:hypothetical protein